MIKKSISFLTALMMMLSFSAVAEETVLMDEQGITADHIETEAIFNEPSPDTAGELTGSEITEAIMDEGEPAPEVEDALPLMAEESPVSEEITEDNTGMESRPEEPLPDTADELQNADSTEAISETAEPSQESEGNVCQVDAEEPAASDSNQQEAALPQNAEEENTIVSDSREEEDGDQAMPAAEETGSESPETEETVSGAEATEPVEENREGASQNEASAEENATVEITAEGTVSEAEDGTEAPPIENLTAQITAEETVSEAEDGTEVPPIENSTPDVIAEETVSESEGVDVLSENEVSVDEEIAVAEAAKSDISESAATEAQPAAPVQSMINENPADVAAAATLILPENADLSTEIREASDVLMAESEMVLPATTSADNSVSGFVSRLYRTVFQREPDKAGLAFWVNSLNEGGNTAADVVSYFINSPEYQNSGKNNKEIVADLYNTMLNRAPDSEGYQYWLERLDVGMTPQLLISGFVRSIEFTSIASKYGINPGEVVLTSPLDKNFERTSFVYRLYQNCLGRKPDRGGEAYWCAQLENGSTGAEVASGFFFSDEFNKMRNNNSTFVQTLYRTILGREYDTEGLIHWTNKLNYRSTRESVFNGFILSDEFRGQCETAQINSGNPIATPDDTAEWQYNIQVLDLCNRYRREAGLADLYTREDLLNDVAMKRADEITGVFSHTRPDGTAWSTMFTEQGFYGYLGENLAGGPPYANPEEVVKDWMNSPGHRANILNGDYTYLATGLVHSPDTYTHCLEGKYSGQYVRFEYYSAQSFCNYGMKIN